MDRSGAGNLFFLLKVYEVCSIGRVEVRVQALCHLLFPQKVNFASHTVFQ